MTPGYYKTCFVPSCRNNSNSTPGKLFIAVPTSTAAREKWFRTVNIKQVPRTTRYCCEDHFNLQEDAENWRYFKAMGTVLRIRPGVAPHLFLTSSEEKPPSESQYSPTSRKRKKEARLALTISSSTSHINHKRREPTPSTSTEKSVSFSLNKPVQFCYMPAQSVYVKPFIELKPLEPSTSSILVTESETLENSCSIATPHESENDNFSVSFGNEQKQYLEAQERYFSHYLGLPEDIHVIVGFCEKNGHVRKHHTLLTLKKIRSDDEFDKLADDFGMNVSSARNIFRKTVPVLCVLLKQLIVWPSSHELSSTSKYVNAMTVIDCFEIPIDKPTNLVNQYYKATTLKYLISVSPNGLINYVSTGFLGRISDKMLVEKSEFLNVVPDNYTFMTDRGFGQISRVLLQKGSQPLKSPSTERKQQNLSKVDVKAAEEIAAVRINIERVIGRLRQFKMLVPHSHLDYSLIYLMDNVIVIVCGILNVQLTNAKMPIQS